MLCFNITLFFIHHFYDITILFCSKESQAIEKYNFVASMAYLKWTANWTIFIDSLLQLHIFQVDSRSLHLPIFVSKVDIVTDAHLDMIKETFKNSATTTPTNLLVYRNRSTGNIM